LKRAIRNYQELVFYFIQGGELKGRLAYGEA